jgi:hypothetical protein
MLLISGVVFWESYSFPVKVEHGIVSRRDAIEVVVLVSVLVTCLAVLAWQMAGANGRARRSGKAAMFSAFLLAAMLSAYAYCAISFNGENWRYMGKANTELFRETDRLIFIIEAIPLLSFLAGVLVLTPTLWGRPNESREK